MLHAECQETWVPHKAAGPWFMLGLDNSISCAYYGDLKRRQNFCHSLLRINLSSALGSLVNSLRLQ